MGGLSRFKGSLIGVLMGDCLGAPFEGLEIVRKININKYFAQLHDTNLRIPFKPFTDDTAMTKSVALSLINCKGYNANDMSKRFVTEYLKEPKRGYGSAVGDVFMGLRLSNFEDPYGPAQRQFQGMGSYGNGAAMRIAPIALYAHSSVPRLIELSTLSSKITHSNKLGYRGAILQALAIRQALYTEPAEFNVLKFTDDLILKMKEIEAGDVKDELEVNLLKNPTNNNSSYVTKLEIVKSFLSQAQPPPMEEIHEQLGVHVSAHRSVPTALYCFLLAQKPVPEIECDNKFQRCIQFAISLGGDTDTIASMAAAISGAHVGMEGIPEVLLKHCEAVPEVLKWAEDLHALAEAAGDSDSKIQAKSQ